MKNILHYITIITISIVLPSISIEISPNSNGVTAATILEIISAWIIITHKPK